MERSLVVMGLRKVRMSWRNSSIAVSSAIAVSASNGFFDLQSNCAVVFPSPKSHLNYRYLHDRCKQMAKAAGLDETEWHLHKVRDSAATRCCALALTCERSSWLGHESLATTQKYLEPSKERQEQLGKMKLPL